MNIHIEYQFDTMQYAIYFFNRMGNSTTQVLIPDPDLPGRFKWEFFDVGTRWDDQPTIVLDHQMYEDLRDAMHPDQEKLSKLTLKNYEREQDRVDKLMDHVMRLES